MELAGKVAVVTGGGSGIGAATAKLLCEAGARVAICGRTLDKLANVAREASPNGEIAAIRADISSPLDMQRLFDEVDRRWSRLDILFAHAGVNGVWAPLEEITAEEWQRTIQINLNGTFFTIKHALPLLKRQGGTIVITSSINGTQKFSDVGSSAYSSSKAALVALAKMLALELAPAGIRVNAVCPGSIDTEVEEHMEMRNTRATEQIAHYYRGGIPLTGGKPGSAREVAELVLFLVSERASHITGTPVWIDGGQSLVQA